MKCYCCPTCESTSLEFAGYTTDGEAMFGCKECCRANLESWLDETNKLQECKFWKEHNLNEVIKINIYMVYTSDRYTIESLRTLGGFKSQERAEEYIKEVIGTEEDEGEVSWILVPLEE